MGCHRYHSIYLPSHLYVYRGKSKLPPRHHSHVEVRRRTFLPAIPFTDLAASRCSYLVLAAGFFFAPHQVPDQETTVFTESLFDTYYRSARFFFSNAIH